MRRATALPIVLVLWLGGLCAAAQFAKVALVLPELGRLYPEAGAALGFLVSSISVVGALFGLLAGALAARIGPRRLLLAGLTLGAGVSLVQALLPPLPLLLATRLLEGVAHLAIVVAAPTLIAAASAERLRAAAMTLWSTFFGVSFAVTGWLGLPLVAARGVDALFLVHGLCTGAIAVLVAVVSPAVRIEPHSGPGGAPGLSLSAIAHRHVRAWRSPSIAAPAAGWVFYTLTFVALLAVLPGTMPPAERAFTAAALPLASIVASMTLGVLLLRWLSAVQVLAIGFSAATGIAFVLALVPGEPLVCVALFASLGLVQGASFAAVPQLNPAGSDQALANGALAQAGNVGNLCGTPLLLALIANGGYGAMIALVVVCYVAALGAHAWLATRRRMCNMVQRCPTALARPAPSRSTLRDHVVETRARAMAKSSIKKPDTYEALRDKGMSKSKAAAIANAQAAGDIDHDSRPYEERDLRELRELARERDIEGRSGMNKAELVEALRRG